MQTNYQKFTRAQLGVWLHTQVSFNYSAVLYYLHNEQPFCVLTQVVSLHSFSDKVSSCFILVYKVQCRIQCQYIIMRPTQPPYTASRISQWYKCLYIQLCYTIIYLNLLNRFRLTRKIFCRNYFSTKYTRHRILVLHKY